ncbi:MAG: helix-turn-helix domain-containing protein [Candidatus Thorarchaeota archaeon]
MGLTTNEARAYVSLVRLGKATARAIHEDSEIPRSKVYETVVNPLVVLFQWQVVKTVLAAVESIMEKRMS